MKNSAIVNAFIRVWKIIPKQFHRRLKWIFLVLIISSILEVFSLAAVLPLFAAVLKPDFISTQPHLSKLYKLLAFSSEAHFIFFISGAVMLLVLLKNSFGIWVQFKQASFNWSLHETLSIEIFKNVYKRGFTFFSENNSNVILNRVTTVPQNFAQILILSAFNLITEIVMLIIIMITLLIYDPIIILLLTAIITPVFLIFYSITKKKITLLGKRLNELFPLLSKPVFEVIFGFVDVLINNVFSSQLKLYKKWLGEAKKHRVTLLVIQNIPNRLIESSVILAIIVMLLYGFFYIDDAEKTGLLITVFGLAAYRTIPSVNRIMLAIVNIKSTSYTLDYIEKYLENGFTEVVPEKHLVFNTSFVLNEISYSYAENERPVIHDYSLEIKKGELIGLMGKSGSGKTTLMNIMLGFLTPSKGSIEVDGVQVEKDSMCSWQSKCGYVRQDVFLIDGSISDNVAFGISKDMVDNIRLKESIERAQLEDLVNSFTDGLQTQIGERGAKLSGGQRQRIGIARALYHGAEILFFDEATSALDSDTEREVTEAINELRADNLTMVIIAHRESTLKYCDKIYSLK